MQDLVGWQPGQLDWIFWDKSQEGAGFWDGDGLLLGPLVEAFVAVGLRVGLALSDPFDEVPEGDEIEDVVVFPGTLEEGTVGVRGIPLLDPLGEVLEGFELEDEEPLLPLLEEFLEAIGLEVVSERNKR